MTLFKKETNVRLSNEDHIETTLARLGRIARKGLHPGRYIFYEHEVKQVLRELVKEITENTEKMIEEETIVSYQIDQNGVYSPLDKG